ncbi:hypothetical protein A9Q76_06825 [Arcobacter sp. 31_11_sub10_T18]|nr:hypothetical protein A9Q76_06825 [Arcobacter sp. 31_11_sub10_T18]
MDILIIILLIFIVFIDAVSLYKLYENIVLFTFSEVVAKTLFILFIPFFGGLFILYQIAQFYKNNRKNSGGEELGSDVIWYYNIWPYYSSAYSESHSSDTSPSSDDSSSTASDYGSSDGGAGSGD